MKEQIAGWLLATLQQATNAVEKGAQFLGDQLPLIVQEFLWFSLLWHWLIVISIPLGILIYLFAVVKFWKTIYRSDLEFVVLGVGIVGGSIAIMGFGINLYYALLVTFAPRVFLLKEFMGFFR